MKKNLLLALITALPMTIGTATAQTTTATAKAPSTPKLVVGIVVDQMRYDYIYRFWDKYGTDGFKRLVNEGYFCRNTNYNYVPTYTGPGHASVYTGTTPAVHGIISNNWYVPGSKNEVYCATDTSVRGVGVGPEVAEGKRSPQRMLTTTVGDQLRLSSNMQSKVIGIALKDRASILPAGHTANAAYWFDEKSNLWISSTFYMNALPQWVSDFNTQKKPQQYLAQDWTTLLPAAQYTQSITDLNGYEGKFPGETTTGFPHKSAAISANIKATPWGNDLTKDFALATIKAENLGKGTATDFLAVSFSSTDYVGHMFGPQSMEVEDTYLRLDKDLAELLKFLDTWVGKQNVVVFLTADHGAVENPQYLIDNKIPAGFFNEKMAVDSLKKMLKKQYGDTTLLLAYSNQQVFLNHNLIRSKNWNQTEIENRVADLFLGFTGVETTVTATALRNTQFTDKPRSLVQLGWNATRSGDVCVVYQPGWFEDGFRTGTTHGAPWSYDTHVPLLWYGWKIKNGSSDEAQNITDIAPTVCQLLNIQFPNGCTGKPITGMTK